jgi:hypothetical protein
LSYAAAQEACDDYLAGRRKNLHFYYSIKPFIPRRVQVAVRRQWVRSRRQRFADSWPIKSDAGKRPFEGFQWPEGKRFALVLTHDVETERGQTRCLSLLELEKDLGFRSSFNFVPERYQVSSSIREAIAGAQFEVGVHGLKHDGKLYRSREIFSQRAVRINRYLRDWRAVGFRSPSMHHNLDWIHDLEIEYDSSTFDTDPFEPQSDGVGTVFPFWVPDPTNQSGYVELPCTLPQDFTLFALLKQRTNDIWKEKLDWIAHVGGLALFNTHPDYMCFGGQRSKYFEYPVRLYEAMLNYVKDKYERRYWHALPKELSRFWKGKQNGKGGTS